MSALNWIQKKVIDWLFHRGYVVIQWKTAEYLAVFSGQNKKTLGVSQLPVNHVRSTAALGDLGRAMRNRKMDTARECWKD
jgi:hypothetical protein